MGRDVAEAVPEAMAVYERGSEACGLDLKHLCFDTPLEEMVETEVQQPALVATRSRCWPPCARTTSTPTT